MNRQTLNLGQAIGQMVQTHPQRTKLEPSQLAQHLQTLNECSTTCTICADACLHEDMVKELTHCIRLNLDCADICRTTASVVARVAQPDSQVLRSLLQACQNACRACAAECEKHAQMHEHCRVCAESCRRCEEACGQLLGQM